MHKDAGPVGNPFVCEANPLPMTPKVMLTALAVCAAITLAGCTGGSDKDSSSSSTTATGGAGVGGCVTVGSQGGCTNTTASGSSTMTSTSSNTNSTTGNVTVGNSTGAVTLKNTAFNPSDITIKAGGTVTWTHDDGSNAHTVTGQDFDSSPNCASPVTQLGDCMMQGDTYEHTFSAPGDYAYHCKIHSSMTGTVHVVA